GIVHRGLTLRGAHGPVQGRARRGKACFRGQKGPRAKPERSLNDGPLIWRRKPEIMEQFSFKASSPRLCFGVNTMAARVSSRRRWFLRDIPRPYVLIVWLTFGLAAVIYAYDWHPSGWSALRPEANVKPQHREPEHYAGSIIIVPMGGEQCWQRII